MRESNSSIQQHEPLRVPQGWNTQEKRFVAQVEEILDDLYSRFNRLKLKDLSQTLQQTIIESYSGTKENGTAILQTAEQISLLATKTNNISGQVETLNTSYTQTAEQIKLLASKELVDAIACRVGKAETSITQTAEQIKLLATKETVDALTGRVSTAETSITQTANQIKSLATQKTVDDLAGRVTTAESSITQNANDIKLKVSTTTYNSGMAAKANASDLTALATRVTTAESSISQNAKNIELRVTTSTYNTGMAAKANTSDLNKKANASDLTALTTRVSTAESTISQHADAIELRVTTSTYNAGMASKANTSDLNKKANSSDLTALTTRVTTAEASIKTNADAITAKVSKGDIASTINQTAQSVKIQAGKIAFEGAVTANNNFKIDTAGNLTCNSGTFTNGTFSGALTAGNWKFNSSGSTYTNGSLGINMTMLTGGGFVGGGSSNRAFYGSTGCDVQYGSDYSYQCIIRGGTVGIYTGNSTGVMIEHVNGAEDPSLYCVGAGSTWNDAVGNLGGASHRWDVGYIRSFNQSSSKYVKHDIKDMPDMGDIIDRLRPVTFVYNSDKNEQTQYGLIYEEAIDVFDHICLRPKTGDVNEIGIDYTKLISVLLEGIRSLRRRVAALEN